MINHKYQVGDKVKVRDAMLNPSCGLLKLLGQVVEITGIAPSYNNKPCYYVNNDETTVFHEGLFAGKVD
jgi:hypothetical protein